MKLNKIKFGIQASRCACAAFLALGICASFNAKALTPTVIGSATNGGSVYYLLSSSSWTDAETAAVALGGTLATVSNQAQQSWIWNTFGSYGNVNRDLWIGLYDPSQDSGGGTHAGNFSWVSGSSSAYLDWYPGEPNNGGTTGIHEYYGFMDYFYGGLWDDGANVAQINGKSQAQFGLVQVQLVPEPSTSALMAFGTVASLIFSLRRKQ